MFHKPIAKLAFEGEDICMKKLIAFVLALICILLFSGCNSYDIDPAFLTCFTAKKASLEKPDLQMTQEQAAFIIGVWNDSDWKFSITKTMYDYVFRGENIEMRYCYDEGIFNDVINNRHVFLSDEIREQVNKTIDEFAALSVTD
jgi:hypothetical protein